jgi:hypothetical protein
MTPEEQEYQKKLEEQKRKREQVIKMKEANRQKAAKVKEAAMAERQAEKMKHQAKQPPVEQHPVEQHPEKQHPEKQRPEEQHPEEQHPEEQYPEKQHLVSSEEPLTKLRKTDVTSPKRHEVDRDSHVTSRAVKGQQRSSDATAHASASHTSELSVEVC